MAHGNQRFLGEINTSSAVWTGSQKPGECTTVVIPCNFRRQSLSAGMVIDRGKAVVWLLTLLGEARQKYLLVKDCCFSMIYAVDGPGFLDMKRRVYVEEVL